jgi:inorganic phosphate transporter, PiT family
LSLEAVVLVAAAVLFSVINGVNDGGALMAVALKAPASRIYAFAALAGLIVVAPLLLGTEVATTLADRLVSFERDLGRDEGLAALAVAVFAAILVVGVLARSGLPTSLTLALIGGIAGAGIGFGAPVAWDTVLLVLAIAAAAPILGGLIAWLLTWAAGLVPPGGRAGDRLRHAHLVSFTLLYVAYGANDGQKMLAIFAVAFGTASGGVDANLGQLLAIAALFAIGTVTGLRRMAGTLIAGVLLARPIHVVAAEGSASVAVLGSAALGAPVSITQAVTGGLVGSGVESGYLRVRWQVAGQVVLAWTLTLPAAVVAAVVAGSVVRALSG